MAATVQDQKSAGSGRFALSLLMVVPSVLSFLASDAIIHEFDFPASALWLIYEVSWYIGIVGTVIVAGMALDGAVRRTIAPVFVYLIGVVALTGIVLIWYASHIYRSPWYS